MSTERCEEWRGLIALRALGDAAGDEAIALDAHLEGCVECRAIEDEMGSTVAVLGYVEPSSIEPTALVPTDLSTRVLSDLHQAGLRRHRRRQLAVGAGSLAGAIAAAIVLFAVVFNASPSPSQRIFALSGTASASAKAVLVTQSWGTSVNFSERGLPGGGIYTVSMKTATGAWWTAGTYRSVFGRTVSATMACAVPMKDITGLRVENARGVTVLSSAAYALTYQ
ncbi:MAG: zf-HC2 domain-containing protein [Acidimicrobiales bacterium]